MDIYEIIGMNAFAVIILAIFIKINGGKKSGEFDTRKPRQNSFTELRELCFKKKSDFYFHSLEKNSVVGILMDLHLGNGILFCAGYRTGEASLYCSSGGGIVGGVQQESLNEAVKSYLSAGRKFVEHAHAVQHTDLPEPHAVNFFLLTPTGKLLLTDTIQNLENGSSRLCGLFEEANKVIEQLRKFEEVSAPIGR